MQQKTKGFLIIAKVSLYKLRGVRLKDARAVRLLLSKLIKSNLDGDLSNDGLRAITTACNTILSTLEKGEIEDRLSRLEQILNDRQK